METIQTTQFAPIFPNAVMAYGAEDDGPVDAAEDDGPVDASDYKEAIVHGVVDDALLDRAIEIGGSSVGAKTASGRWKSTKGTVRHLIDNLAEHKIGTKDGECFTQGGLLEGERRNNYVSHLDLCALDLDTGESFDAVRERIMELGLFAVLYTTYSNMKPQTSVKKKAVTQWCGSDDPNLEHVKSYLMEVKRYQRSVLEGAVMLGEKATDGGVELLIKHKPMEKFRVVFVLKERFVMAERGATQKEAI